MVAVKGNREYKIKDDADKERFINAGYDIYEKGKLIARGKGKKVDIAEYDKVVKERDALKAELDKFKKDTKEKEQKEK